jgi:anti-sigma regulatory factor (Ser/Thr protein kinase)
MNGSAVTWASPAPNGAARAAGGRAGPEAPGPGRAAADGRRPGRGGRVPVLPPPCQGTAMAYQWPLRDFLEYGALPSAVPSARLHARQIAWEWGLSALGENVELMVSELMTNGIAAARAIEPISPVRLWLLADTIRILILVWDANPHPPAPVQADEYAESGRGLLLVQALSQRWGSYPTPQMGGKVVWALCRANTGHANPEGNRGA